MTELIKINETEGKKTVSARELHQKLEVTERFSAWYERMLKYGFEENIDYVGCKEFNALAKQELQNYYVSLDMAKEICMIQRSEIGKKFRRYFIECEKQLRDVVSVPNERIIKLDEDKHNLEKAKFIYLVGQESPVETYKQICAAISVNMVAGQRILPMPKIKKEVFTATQIAEKLGVTKQKVGMIANEHNLKTKEYGEFIWDRATNGKQVENFVYYDNAITEIQKYIG